MRKGISPLIGAVLLIAFTMAVAAILTAWITSLTTTQTEFVGNRTSSVVKCSFANMAIFDAVWDSVNNKVIVSIANTGTIDLNDVNVFAFVGDNRYQSNSGQIASADIVSVEINGVNSKPDRVLAISKDCPNLKDEERTISVK